MFPPAEVEEHANAVRPVMHAATAELLRQFLHLKRTEGSAAERRLYTGMDTPQFVTRLLVQRPLAFLTASDSYMMRDGVTRGHVRHDGVLCFVSRVAVWLCGCVCVCV